MPISVYIAPFKWYEKKKQQESFVYRQIIVESLHAWHQVSQGLIRFHIVGSRDQSQIDFSWRRVDRKSLGHCEYAMTDDFLLYSAEISIGISDGLLHSTYDNTDEVRHTVLHEIGHALGLIGHSDNPGDIMYVPHQYGVFKLSARDIESLRWLYRLPAGFNYKQAGHKYQLKPPFTLHDVINRIEGRIIDKIDDKASTSAPQTSKLRLTQ